MTVMKTVARRMRDLRETIHAANTAYHRDDDPIMPDARYDALRRELVALEAENPDLKTPDSPTRGVGAAPAEGFGKVRHEQRMMSLANAFDEADLLAFREAVRSHLGFADLSGVVMTAEPKIDGLSLTLRYEAGRLVRAATRGDGEVGEDVTANALMIDSIPQYVADAPDIMEIRGEVYMRHADFRALNERQAAAGEKPYANPRNAAAGSLRQLDSGRTRSRGLAFFAYSWGVLSCSLGKTQRAAVARMARMGFETNPLFESCGSIDEMLAHYERVLSCRPDLGYDIDGVVYKIDALDLQHRLGFRSTTPRWAIAHKFPAEKSWTRIDAIDIQVGRTGALSPVARLAPINVGGVLVSNATLHNADYIAGRNSSGAQIRGGRDIRVGDWVEVCRAGDVIPKVSDVDIARRSRDAAPYAFPESCPRCGSGAVRKAGDAVHYCTGGMICPAQAIERMRHAVSRDALDIDGVGESLVDLLHRKGWITEPSDIFLLPRDRAGTSDGSLAALEGFGAKSSRKIFESIEAARRQPLSRVIYACGIVHVGRSVSKSLAAHYGAWKDFAAAMDRARIGSGDVWEDLIAIDGIGEVILTCLITAFHRPAERAAIDRLAAHLDIEAAAPAETSGSEISGKTIVFTGTLARMSRAEARARAEQLGAKVSGSVSRRTDILVAGEKTGSKAENARGLGVDVIDEDRWLEMAGAFGQAV